jgi:1-pyrroline-5-carboxylate dehydrogenase
MKEKLISLMKDLKISSPLEFDTFTSAVIDEPSFNRISSYINYGKNSSNVNLLAGGNVDNSKGYYVQPTLFEVKDSSDKLLREEIFGPVLTIYVYKNSDYNKVIDLVDSTTPYALTGSIFATDKDVLNSTKLRLRQACGNLYINDKSTGAGNYFFFMSI